MQETSSTPSNMPLEMPWLTPDALPSGQSLGQILKASFQQYFKNGWTLTRPLLVPLLKIFLGGYACIILNYLYINGMANAGISLILLGMLVITALTLWPFLTGFWQYIVFFASLNRNAAEAFAGQPIQPAMAYKTVLKNNSGAYQLLLLAYFCIPLLVFFILSALSVGAISSGPAQDTASLAASGLAALALQGSAWIISGVLAILFTFIFQSAAFEKLPLNPFPILLASMRLVKQRWLVVVVLQFILAFLTTILLPALISTLFRLLSISKPLDMLHTWLIHIILEGAAPSKETAALLPPAYVQLFQTISDNISAMASALTDSILAMLLTALLLPLGTLAFTRLYWDIRFKAR
jgi:hypothetical protein